MRPLIDGASWGYAGTDTLNGVSTSYSNTVTQVVSGGILTERASNAFRDGVDAVTLSASGGAVYSSALAALTGISTQLITYPELRSPVRLNDQVTVLDQRFSDIGIDSDGDGKRDSGEIGIYRIVAGLEDVILANGATRQAVRVDMFAIARVTLSSTGVTSPATQVALQSTWFAEGIGVVKQRLTTPVSATSNQVVEEVLTYFDGISKGFGAAPAVQVRMAADAAVDPDRPLESAISVVGFSDHAVLIGDFVGSQSTRSTAISSVDKRGQVTRTSLYAGLQRSGFVALGDRLLAVVTADNMASSCQFELMHFDAHGVRVTGRANSVITIRPALGQTLCSGVPQLQFAVDGSRLWVAMVRRSLSSSGWVTDLVVRPFDAEGNPLADETTVFSANRLLSTVSTISDGLTLQSASAAGGKVVVGYLTDGSGKLKLASVTDAGVVTRTEYAPATARLDAAAVLATSKGAALLWQGPQDPLLRLAPARGVLLDVNLLPQLSSDNGLDAQNLLGAPACTVACLRFMSGPGDSIWVGKAALPSDAPGVLSFASYNASAGALAAQDAQLAQFSLADIDERGLAINQFHVIPFADRTLVVASARNKLYTKIFWQP